MSPPRARGGNTFEGDDGAPADLTGMLDFSGDDDSEGDPFTEEELILDTAPGVEEP